MLDIRFGRSAHMRQLQNGVPEQQLLALFLAFVNLLFAADRRDRTTTCSNYCATRSQSTRASGARDQGIVLSRREIIDLWPIRINILQESLETEVDTL